MRQRPGLWIVASELVMVTEVDAGVEQQRPASVGGQLHRAPLAWSVATLTWPYPPWKELKRGQLGGAESGGLRDGSDDGCCRRRCCAQSESQSVRLRRESRRLSLAKSETTTQIEIDRVKESRISRRYEAS